MIRSFLLNKYKNISHGFFNKNGGISTGIYKSLNCGSGSNDLKKNIEKNLKIVCEKIGCQRKNLILLKQIHSNKVHTITKSSNIKLIGDATITNDCAPVILFDPKINFVSVIHVGWKGAFKQIIKKCIKEFINNGSVKKNIIAVIGPCISKKNYDVKDDFFQKDTFLEKNNFFSHRRSIKQRLSDYGRNISVIMIK